MPIHLEPGPDNVHWGYFDARLTPRVTIDNGDIGFEGDFLKFLAILLRGGLFGLPLRFRGGIVFHRRLILL